MLNNPSVRLQLRGSFPGVPVGSQEFFAIPMKAGDSLPAGAPGWLITCEIAPAADWTVTLNKNGAAIGTAKILAGALTGAWTFAARVAFADNDILSFVAPVVADANVSSPGWFIHGTSLIQ